MRVVEKNEQVYRKMAVLFLFFCIESRIVLYNGSRLGENILSLEQMRKN
jgi:hypothetical protein